jgi:hypothetical protein
MRSVHLYEVNNELKPQNYKNKNAYTSTLGNTVGAMGSAGFGVPECKKKTRNIHSHYYQELTEISNINRSGRSPDSVHKAMVIQIKTMDGFLWYL